MKRKTLIVLSGLCLAISQFMINLPLATPEVAAQGGIAEVEPNDNKGQAQRLELTPGATIVVNGAVARGDGGSLVEELPTLEGLLFAQISADDPLEDWFVVEVNGGAEFAVELTWPGESDLDLWVLADMSSRVFSDGLVSYELEASNANPEIEENRNYYVYSDRQTEVDEGPFTVPPVSRYYIAVSNFNDGVSPPANYTLTLRSPAPGTTRTVVHSTSGPGRFSPIFPSDLGGFTLLALQRITPPEYPARLDQTELLQFDLSDLGERRQIGARVDLVVLADAAGTGNPANATEVLRRSVAIAALNAFNGYSVQDANLIVQSGDLYVGFEMTEMRSNGLHIPFDIDKAGYGRTFISTDRGQTYGRLQIVSPEVGIPFVANVGINALFTINPAASAQAAGRSQVRVRGLGHRGIQVVKDVSFVKLR